MEVTEHVVLGPDTVVEDTMAATIQLLQWRGCGVRCRGEEGNGKDMGCSTRERKRRQRGGVLCREKRVTVKTWGSVVRA